uniref:Uncharacterized protein n=1 Tax=Leersia perrieri TaxID=77586 RepID=A0A0D9XVE3_9ORYZ
MSFWPYILQLWPSSRELTVTCLLFFITAMHLPVIKWLVWANLQKYADENPPYIRLMGCPHKCSALKLPPEFAIQLVGERGLADSSNSHNGHHLELLLSINHPTFKLIHIVVDTNITTLPTQSRMRR